METYAAYTKNEYLRMNSSSGGLFSELALHILNQGGVVFGCALDKNQKAVHIMVEDEKDLERLRGSKYVQSDINKAYIECRRQLLQKRKVLFTGTPCQIDGLYRYLDVAINSEYLEFLYTQDLICHGVPSPMVWKDYLLNVKKQYGEKEIERVSFRDKTFGWRLWSVKIDSPNKKVVHEDLQENVYAKGFLKDLYLRPSCYQCKSKKKNRCADVTLADFWGIESVLPEFSDDKGISLMIIHSLKGKTLLKNIEKNIEMKEVSLDEAVKYNPSMIVSSSISKRKRKKFFQKYSRIDSIEKLDHYIQRYGKEDFSKRCYFFIRRNAGKVVRKLGIRK